MRRRQVYAQKTLQEKLKKMEMVEIPKPKRKAGRPPGSKKNANPSIPEVKDSDGPSQD